MDLSASTHGAYVFGRYRLDAVRRVLLRDAIPVNLPPRLFETLLYLVENAGRIVEREELLRNVWAGRVVEDANIKQAIFSLRKILQDDGAPDRLIVTAPMRGYRFAAAVHFEGEYGETVSTAASPTAPAWTRWGAIIPALLLAAAVSAALLWQANAPDAAPHSIAILPFANLSGDPAQDYVSDGISDELISALGRIDGLHVVARSSAFALKGKDIGATEVGRRLHVRTVLEGSVRRDGNHLRITAELVDAATGFALWAQAYDRQSADVFRAQQDIATAVAGALQGSLLGGEAAKFTLGGTQNPGAYDSYLRGMALLDRQSDATADLRDALAAFDAAIALDPFFALARAHRSHVLTLTATGGTLTDPAAVQSTLAQARAEAERAIAIAPDLAGGHLARGTVLLMTQDYAGAEKEILLARDLAPGDAVVLLNYAGMEIAFGRLQSGVAAAQQAAWLDPLTPSTYGQVASLLTAAGRYDDANAALRRARILEPAFDGRPVEANIALGQGDFATAAKACAAAQTMEELVCLAIADDGLGRRADGLVKLQALQKQIGDDGAYQYAEIYAQWRMPGDAVHWLREAVRLHDPGLMSIESDRLIDPLRGAAPFRQIENAVGIPAWRD